MIVGIALAAAVADAGASRFFLAPHGTPRQAKASCDNPRIKGNISYSTGTKICHVPGGQFYDKTQIDPGAGERIVLHEDEAS